MTYPDRVDVEALLRRVVAVEKRPGNTPTEYGETARSAISLPKPAAAGPCDPANACNLMGFLDAFKAVRGVRNRLRRAI
jgi:hypothetical protein